MIKPEELRYGNLVLINNTRSWGDLKGIPAKVIGISERNDKLFPNSAFVLDLRIGRNTYSQFNEFIEGIPLSPEWLERGGYIWSGRYFRNYEFDTVIDFRERSFLLYGDYIGQPLQFVHEWQNGHRFLTGKELELKQ